MSVGAPRQAPATRRGRETRAALLRAARAVFERDGYLDARIGDIAREAGVATGSFYTYFDDKAALFAALLEETTHAQLAHPGVPDASADDDPVALIEQANRAYLDVYRRNWRLMRLFEQVATIDEAFAELRRQRSHAFTARNARSIRRLQEQGRADPALDPELASLALSAMVSRAAHLVYTAGVHDVAFEALVATLTRLWANALGLERADTDPPRPRRSAGPWTSS